MKYAFIHCLAVDCAAIDEKAGHRGEFGVRAMCRVLRVHFSGFYACLTEPLSHRAQEVVRQTELIRRAWADSGKVYSYRKLTEDLRDQGERVSENRVARLSSLAGIAAQIGYSRRPGRYGGQPAVGSENKLNQKFHASQRDQVWGRSLWRHLDPQVLTSGNVRQRPALCFRDIPFHAMFEGLGGYGELVTKRAVLPGALESAIASGRMACINVKARGVISPIVAATSDKRDKASIEK